MARVALYTTEIKAQLVPALLQLLLKRSSVIYKRISAVSFYYNEAIRRNFFVDYTDAGAGEAANEPMSLVAVADPARKLAVSKHKINIQSDIRLPVIENDDAAVSSSDSKAINSFDDFWNRIYGLFFNENLKSFWFRDGSGERNRSRIAENNRRLGLVRFRQLRVGNVSCPIPDVLGNMYRNCYAAFDHRTESKEAFRLASAPGWYFTRPEQLHGHTWNTYIGHAARDYHGGGFYFDLQFENEGKTRQQLDEYRTNFWLDKQSRVVFVDFVIFNPNLNLINVVKFIYEFLATGFVKHEKILQITKLSRYDSRQEYVILAYELMLLIFLLVFSLRLAKSLIESLIVYRLQFLVQFLSNFWNIYDSLLLILLWYYLQQKLAFDRLALDKNREIFAKSIESYYNFESFALQSFHFDNFFGFTYFVAWLKLMKFINFNRTISYFSLTLQKSAKHVFGFLLIFLIIFTSFSQFGYLMFGTYSKRFRTYKTSVVTLLRVILNDFQYNEIERTNIVIGPIFFLLYIFVIFFVLMNMFLAIIDNSYMKVRSGFELQDRLEFKHFLKNVFANFYAKVQTVVCKAAPSQKLLRSEKFFEKVANSLKKCGFSDKEIENFIDKQMRNKHFKVPKEILIPLVDWDTYLQTLNRLQERMRNLHDKIQKQVKNDLAQSLGRSRSQWLNKA